MEFSGYYSVCLEGLWQAVQAGGKVPLRLADLRFTDNFSWDEFQVIYVYKNLTLLGKFDIPDDS